jgi:hypothetical protein
VPYGVGPEVDPDSNVRNNRIDHRSVGLASNQRILVLINMIRVRSSGP